MTWSRCCVLALWWVLLTVGVARAAEALPPGRSAIRTFGGADALRNLAITDLVQDHEGQHEAVST
ncbi:MAG: hypothetical protein H7138_27990 [Myxococcales bacterium]|nr:hypothetical protein [Myxococcales bacterium]